jgi:serine protease Do
MVRQALGLALVVLGIASFAGCKRTTGESRDDLPRGAVPVDPSSVPPPLAPAPSTAPPNVPPPATAALDKAPPGAPMSFAPIAHRADPSVVAITTRETTQQQTIFGVRVGEATALGSGFVLDKDGTIVTNNHVVEGASAITVKLADERTFPAKVVGTDPSTDMGVIRIVGATGLTPLPLGDSDAIEVGDWVVAIGNPFGLSHTVSAGIISAKGRGKEDVPLGDPAGYYNFLQTDASINPGNSGGPLLNLRGEVVGINTAIRADANTIGFAIPINMVKQLLPMLIRDGHVTRSALGAVVRTVRLLPPEDLAQLKLPDDKGVIVTAVVPDGPADKAGVIPGDVIRVFDGETVDRDDRLRWLASVAGVGTQVTLRVARQGKLFDQKVTLGQLAQLPPQSGQRGSWAR